MKYILALVVVFYTATTSGVSKTSPDRIPRSYFQWSRETQSPCTFKTTCHECIQTPTCAWCAYPSRNFQDSDRCFQPGSMPNVCPEEYIWNPDNYMYLIKAVQLSQPRSTSAASISASEIVQVYPQYINLRLKKNDPYKIDMHYSQSLDFPVDLYYLTDLSKSMLDDKENLAILGDLLADSLRNITSDFRIGFGSFFNDDPSENREPVFGFQNHMSLSTDYSTFSRSVKIAPVSENPDAPIKDGFKAIMQAIVCRSEIGWRENSKKILIFATDAAFHSSEDEKVGRIINPDDGLCHLDTGKKYYTYSEERDYPSISQINQKVKETAINVIFAVTKEHFSNYEQLSRQIVGSSVGILSTVSSNVVDLVKEQYQRISSSVEMKDNATEEIRVTYYSSCLNVYGSPKQTNKCENIKVGDVVKFKVKIEILVCPDNSKNWQKTLQIYPVGINDSLIVNLEAYCSCACEQPDFPGYIEKAPECSENGVYKCGICECDSDFFGRRCECSKFDNCRPDNETAIECSGQGNCICGQCSCFARENIDEEISGDYCECDNFSCDRHNGELCSGHGTCVCGKCQCLSPWTGSSCNCPVSNDTCYFPNLEEIGVCSGHGECVCGKCKCEMTENGRYSGKFCEQCPTCPNRCEEFKDCVQCQMYKTGNLGGDEEECARYCTSAFVPISVPKVEADEENGENLCTYYDEDDCKFAYVYSFDDNNRVIIKAQEERNCSPKKYLGMCPEFKQCVQCQMYKTGSLSEKECAENCTFVPIIVQKVKIDEEKDENLCVYYDEDDCKFAYVYSFDDNNRVIIKAQEERDCSPKMQYHDQTTTEQTIEETNVGGVNESNSKMDQKSKKWQDSFDIFGEHVANELRTLSDSKYSLILAEAKRKIYDALNQAEIAKYNLDKTML